MMIRFMLQPGTPKIPKDRIYRYRYMTLWVVRVGRGGIVLIIALIYLDDTNFVFPTDVPSGAFRGS